MRGLICPARCHQLVFWQSSRRWGPSRTGLGCWGDLAAPEERGSLRGAPAERGDAAGPAPALRGCPGVEDGERASDRMAAATTETPPVVSYLLCKLEINTLQRLSRGSSSAERGASLRPALAAEYRGELSSRRGSTRPRPSCAWTATSTPGGEEEHPVTDSRGELTEGNAYGLSPPLLGSRLPTADIRVTATADPRH